MKILSAEQIRQADAYTIDHEPISSLDLMERAASTCVDWMDENLPLGQGVNHVFCGIGNNGGDGLVIARKLSDRGYPVIVYMCYYAEKLSDDCRANLSRLKKLSVEIKDLHDQPDSLKFKPHDRIVDAIFGSGLNRPVTGWVKKLIQSLNEINCLRIAVDLPSGLFASDNRKNDLSGVFQAHLTLTFQVPKLAFVLSETNTFCGEWYVLDIGLSEEFISEQPTTFVIQEESEIRAMLHDRARFSHKGTYGHALMVAGSYGKMGAAVLASRACLRSGVGLLTAVVPQVGYQILQSAVPEAMTFISSQEKVISELPEDLHRFQAIGIGPGLGVHEEGSRVLKHLLETYSGPLVLDADAINLLAQNEALLSALPTQSVLTPHPGEFKRLVGDWKDELEAFEKLQAFCKKFKVVALLKGAYTAICNPTGKIWFNPTGNPGMATGGSGDVLTGIITGLLAQGYVPEEAARLGVYLHGLSGDLGAYEMGEESLIASDIIRYLPSAFNELSLS